MREHEFTVLDVVELNSAAVLQMRQQEFGGAIKSLRSAISALEAIYRTNMFDRHLPNRKRRRVSTDTSVSGESAMAASAVGIVHSVKVMDDAAKVDFCSNSAVSNDNVLLLYDRAFCFLNVDCLDFELTENKSSLSGMVLYNLALAHHLVAIESGSSKDIYDALRFYRLAHLSLEQVKNDVAMEVQILLLLGLINNMGHIHASLFHREQTSSCVDWLRRAVVSKQGAVLDTGDHDFFYTNLRVIPLDVFKFAPAA